MVPADLLTHVNSWIDTKIDSHHDSRAKDGVLVIIIFLAPGHASTATMLGDGVKLGDFLLGNQGITLELPQNGLTAWVWLFRWARSPG